MKKTFKRFLAMCLVILMCVCFNVTALATTVGNKDIVSTRTILENVVFPRGSATQLPSSDSKTITLTGNPTMYGYIVLPKVVGQYGTVNVTVTQTNLPQYTRTVTLIADGKYHEISMVDWGIKAGRVTVSYNGATISLNSISITFAN